MAVYQTFHQDDQQALKDHFHLFYRLQIHSKLIANASYENIGGIRRFLTGMPHCYNNALFGVPPKEAWDRSIEEQLRFFEKIPFVWYLNENENPEFKQKLLERGFTDGGIFQGVIGDLDPALTMPQVPDGYTLELIEDQRDIEEMNDLICAVFHMEGRSKESYQKILLDASKNQAMYHWIARKDGKAVSVLSTIIDGNIVSFWNGASLPEVRRQGVSTALRHLALMHGMSKGCRFGASYLMSDAMALGICTKLGFQPKWRFHVLIAPKA
jgi:Acetyltransferase (GNAT) domain